MRYNIVIGNKTFGNLTEEEYFLISSALEWFSVSYKTTYDLMQFDSETGKRKYFKKSEG